MSEFSELTTKPDLFCVIESFENKLLKAKLNCCRVGIVESFNPVTMMVKVNIVNKMVTDVNSDGSQELMDYPPLYAKVCYANPYCSYPITEGTEGIILFNDREIESWYINGGINQLSSDRSHHITDSIFITGLYSQPRIPVAEYIDDSLHLFYKNSDIIVKDGNITINGNTTINGNLTVNGSINATGDVVAGGISLMNHIHGNGNQGADTTGPK